MNWNVTSNSILKKLLFLKLRNNLFERLRNRGFRKYTLGKLFKAIYYSSRNKLLFKTDPVQFSNVVQETDTETVTVELVERSGSFREKKGQIWWWLQKVILSHQKIRWDFCLLKKYRNYKNRKKIFSLCMVLPGWMLWA